MSRRYVRHARRYSRPKTKKKQVGLEQKAVNYLLRLLEMWVASLVKRVLPVRPAKQKA